MENLTRDTSDTPPCNTIRGRCWTGTWNNYSVDDFSRLKIWLKSCVDFAIQEEVGESGTPHLQFCIKFKNARRFSALKKLYPSVHWEVARNFNAAKNYCLKEETRSGESLSKSKFAGVYDPMENKELYGWQESLLDHLSEEVDDREIMWIVDRAGNAGKTSLAKHLCLKYPDEVLYMGGKASDIKYGVFSFIKQEKKLRIAIFDFTRSLENYISYEAIEAIKNGIFYNTKYESEMCLYNPPHVVCFANFEPEKNKLSLDRWNIIDITPTPMDDSLDAQLDNLG